MILFDLLRRTDRRHEAAKHTFFFSSYPMFKFFPTPHLLKDVYLWRSAIPEKKCFQRDGESPFKACVRKTRDSVEFVRLSDLRTLLPEWFWSVKTKTNQTYDKCLQSGSRVFTRQQLAFKTPELWPKMNRMQPKPGDLMLLGRVENSQWTADRAHRLIHRPHHDCSQVGSSSCGMRSIFKGQHIDTYAMIWFPLESQNCQIMTTFLILHLS